MSAPPPGRATFGDAALALAFLAAFAIPALAGADAGREIPSPAGMLLGAAIPALVALALLARRALLAGATLADAAGYPAARRAAGRDLLRGALYGVLLAAALAPPTAWLFSLLERAGLSPAPQSSADAVLAAAASPAALAACLAALVLVAPLGEELLWRATLQRGLRTRLRAALAIPLAAALFAAAHLSAPHAPALFVVGLVLGLLFDRGSLALSFGCHAAFNAANLALLLSIAPAT